MTFENSKILKKINITKYDVISFDVFDTLLLRTVGEPSDIFTNVGERLMVETALGYTPQAYKSIRQAAAKRASENKSYYSFDDIFLQYPFEQQIIEKAKEYELEEEEKAIYLNPITYSFLEYCASKGKIIILTSDMYLPAKLILDLISKAGGNTVVILTAFISCECGSSKSTGLFNVVKSSFPKTPANRILHIGDNKIADYHHAIESGLDAVHYFVTNRYVGDIYAFEETLYGGTLGELRSLRQLASSVTPDGNLLEPFFKIGSSVVGPLYALFAEWVINLALEREIDLILCNMREGELISKVVNNAIAMRKITHIKCMPIYASRLPLYIEGITEDNYNTRIRKYVEQRYRLPIGEMLAHLGLNISDSPYIDFSDILFCEIDNETEHSEIFNYLLSSNVRKIVLAYAKQQRDYFAEYYRGLANESNVLVIDLWAGCTLQMLFKYVLETASIKVPAFGLMIGRDTACADDILSGVDITSWLGYGNDGFDIFEHGCASIQSVFETIVSPAQGTLLNYEKKGNFVQPILYKHETDIMAEYSDQIMSAFEGVYVFQKIWHDILGKKPHLLRLLNKTREASSIIPRFCDSPTYEEANSAGLLPHIEYWNNNRYSTLAGINEEIIGEELSFIEAFEIYRRYPNRNLKTDVTHKSRWIQACITLAHPAFHIEKLYYATITQYSDSNSRACIIAAAYSKVVIYGAGMRGKEFCRCAIHNNINIYKLTDSNPSLHGGNIYGIDIVPFSSVYNEADMIIVTPLNESKEILLEMDKYYVDSKKPVIIVL